VVSFTRTWSGGIRYKVEAEKVWVSDAAASLFGFVLRLISHVESTLQSPPLGPPLASSEEPHLIQHTCLTLYLTLLLNVLRKSLIPIKYYPATSPKIATQRTLNSCSVIRFWQSDTLARSDHQVPRQYHDRPYSRLLLQSLGKRKGPISPNITRAGLYLAGPGNHV
jgi:hypothetical protein